MTETGSKSVSWKLWAIALPLLLQMGLVLSLPVQAAMARFFGRTVVLRTAPVNPVDPFRGYYTTLSYDISQRGILSTLNGWDTLQPTLSNSQATNLQAPGSPLFVILEAPEANIAEVDNAIALATPPSPWQPIAVTHKRPTNLPANQIALKGLYRRDRINYGLERYYLPETDRIDLEGLIRAAQTAENPPRLMVEVRIGPFGKAFPIALWLQEQRIEF
ncbi:MAG: GDYXXLXY domain-containing protein [Leptolyngbya sp. SIO1D8]|nr:GDYXXLXY domain-containing protein [Leptolyngbya sp. SIO1D8]